MRNVPSLVLMSVPTRPGQASGLPLGASRCASHRSASCAYLGLPVRSLRRVHSRIRVPTSARLLLEAPLMLRAGFRTR